MNHFKLHFIQTGSTRNGEDRIFTGRLDPPLGPQGRAQLKQMQRQYQYPPVTKVYSSPLRRCLHTAAILYPDVPVEIVGDLTAIDIGVFQGRSYQDLQNDPEYVNWCSNIYKYPIQGGEDPREFAKRNIGAVRQLYMRLKEERCTEAAVVTHAGNISSICASIGMPQRALHLWPTTFGTGYTLFFSESLWLRDGLAEIHGALPAGYPGASFDTYWRDAD